MINSQNDQWTPFDLLFFLNVKDPDLIHKEADWRDLEGHSIDCNIYHPKYGYKGFVSNHKGVIATTRHPVSYIDAKTGYSVFCQYEWRMSCIHENGTYTNKDGQIIQKFDVVIPQERLAENEADFIKIYEKEITKRGLKGKQYSDSVFRDALLEHVQNLIQLHKKGTTYDKGMDVILLSLAERFKEWLKSNENIASKPLPPEPLLLDRFNEIKDKFYADNDGKPSKIQKAAMIELFCTKGYFGNNAKPKNCKNAKPKNCKNPVAIWKGIAANYFDEPIFAELESSKKKEREHHIGLVTKHFK